MFRLTFSLACGFITRRSGARQQSSRCRARFFRDARPRKHAGNLFLAGLGLVGLSTCIGALLIMACVGLVNFSVWYARLHFRLLKPAIDQA